MFYFAVTEPLMMIKAQDDHYHELIEKRVQKNFVRNKESVEMKNCLSQQ
jgi:hypothetical protein